MIADTARLMRTSRLKMGPVRATGVPAILLGSAAIVLAAGIARSLATLAPALPETLRETRNLVETWRHDARLLTP
jgi:hypothetical protein